MNKFSFRKQEVSVQLAPIYLKLPKQNIAHLKLVLESYGELGILRTLDSVRGEVVILALSCTADTVYELVESLKRDLELRVIPKPESATNDWLLADEFVPTQ